ncbi:hypothetical protein TUMEXPCC7403_01680 [Tumidithrix helvetica PCC 7403]
MGILIGYRRNLLQCLGLDEIDYQLMEHYNTAIIVYGISKQEASKCR